MATNSRNLRCEDCLEFLQRRLDGDAPAPPSEVHAHLARCPDCRALYEAARRLKSGLPSLRLATPPIGMRERIVRKALNERQKRVQRRRRAFAGLALAASFGLIFVIARTWPARIVEKPGPAPPQVARIDRSVRDAQAALSSIVSRTAAQAIDQGRGLWPSSLPATSLVSTTVFEQPLGRPVDALRQTGQGLTDTLDPVVSSAKRAVRLWIKDDRKQ